MNKKKKKRRWNKKKRSESVFMDYIYWTRVLFSVTLSSPLRICPNIMDNEKKQNIDCKQFNKQRTTVTEWNRTQWIRCVVLPKANAQPMHKWNNNYSNVDE